MKNTKVFILASLIGPVLMSGAARAEGLQALDDDGLSGVNAQAGITVDINGPTTGIAVTQLNTKVDTGTGNATILRADTVSLKSVDLTGATVGATRPHAQIRMDVGAPSAASIAPMLNLQLDLDRSRLAINNLGIVGDTPSTCVPACTVLTSRSYGQMALDAEGRFKLVSSGGLFNGFDVSAAGGSSYDTYLYGALGKWNSGTGKMENGAALFYRQIWFQHAYLVMNNLLARWELNKGSVDIDATGLRQATTDKSVNAIPANTGAGPVDANSLLTVGLDFDLLYKFPYLYPGTDQTQDMVITGNEQPVMHFGWLGSLRNAEVVWKPGGTWTGTDYTSAKTQGINFSTRWDFLSQSEAAALPGGNTGSEFVWELGEASATGADKSRVNFQLGDWVRWNPALYSHNFPFIGLDVINAAQGVNALCWGYKSGLGACSGAGALSTNLTAGTIAGFTDSTLNRADAKAMALMIRDGNLLTYSRRVRFLERDAAGTGISWQRDFKFGLIYTFANVDANAYIYAGGNEGDAAGGSRNGGLIVDLNLMSQTFAKTDDAATAGVDERLYQGFNWETGSHLMIADTDVDGDTITGETRDAMGIGFISTSFMVISNDMSIRLLNATPTDTTLANRASTADPYKGGIDLMSPQTRFTFFTTFGGGILPDSTGSYGTGPTVVKGSLIRLNFEGLLNGRLSPAAGVASSFNPCVAWGYSCKNYLGYSWAIRFMDTDIANFSESTSADNSLTSPDFGSYISFAEPNQPGVDIRLGNITGDVTLENGVIDLVGHLEDPDGLPKVRIAHNVKMGAAAATRMNDAMSGRTALSPAGGQEFKVDRVMLGSAYMGKFVVPSAQIYSSLTLKPQN